MEEKKKITGIALSVIGIFVGVLILYLLAKTYMPVVDGKVLDGRPDEALTVRIVYALLGWVGMAAGALWVAVLYGFTHDKSWAWGWGVVAATVQILSGFFPMIPPASIGMPTPTVSVFIIALVLWFGMLYVGGVNKKITALAFISGLAFVLTFIDGVGSISRYQTVEPGFATGMYAVGQMINWWGAIAWAVFIYAFVKRKSWAIPMGIFAASVAMFGGYPVGLTDVARLHRFSMFLPAPIFSTILLIVFWLPGTRKMIEE